MCVYINAAECFRCAVADCGVRGCAAQAEALSAEAAESPPLEVRSFGGLNPKPETPRLGGAPATEPNVMEYSRGTHAVLTRYSRGTHAVLTHGSAGVGPAITASQPRGDRVATAAISG